MISRVSEATVHAATTCTLQINFIFSRNQDSLDIVGRTRAETRSNGRRAFRGKLRGDKDFALTLVGMVLWVYNEYFWFACSRSTSCKYFLTYQCNVLYFGY